MAILGEIISKYSPDPQVQGKPVELGGLETVRVSKSVQKVAEIAAKQGVDPSFYLIDAASRAVNNGRNKIGHFGEAIQEPISRLKEEMGRNEVTLYVREQSQKPLGERKV